MRILYAFDDTAGLDLVPLAARRALDLAGAKLSLEGWRSLPLPDRMALATAGALDDVDTTYVRAVAAHASPSPAPVPPLADPPANAPPAELTSALGPTRTLEPVAWAALRPLDRYVLAKVASRRRPERIDAAWGEIVGASAELVFGPLSVDRVLARVRRGGAGGLVLFVGTVRDEHAGRAVTRLEYEAYDSMALTALRRIVIELETEIPGVRLAVAHRVGSLAVGDEAVVCAASAPHRQEAFRACEALIDRLKARVPVWKREHSTGGVSWVGWEDARGSGGSGAR